MPCSDITETLTLELDADDRVTRYQLNKRTCGAQIGEQALLSEFLQGRYATEIIDIPDSALGPLPEDEAFLYHKHLYAVQEALKVLFGYASGGPEEPYNLASVAVTPEGETHLHGYVRIDVVGKIKSCGGCGTCSTRKTPAHP